MPNPVTEPYLLNALAHGVVVVLPNRRAARTLRQAFNERQRTAGLKAWDAAPVLAWTDWTRGLWSGLTVQGHELRLLLNRGPGAQSVAEDYRSFSGSGAL